MKGSRPGRKNRSRPASRSRPLATPIRATSVMPRSAKTRNPRGKLSGAAIDEDEIRPQAAGAILILLHQAPETPLQHLAHHADIVAGGDVPAPDVELAIAALEEALGADHDHAADLVGTGDVGVVEDLDALGRRLEAEGGGEAVEQVSLRGALRQPPVQRLARVERSVVDQLALAAALRGSTGGRWPGPRAQAPRRSAIAPRHRGSEVSAWVAACRHRTGPRRR